MPPAPRQSRKGSTGAQPLTPGADLKAQWARLHRGDREPWPDAAAITHLTEGQAHWDTWVSERGGAQTLAHHLQRAWSAFHAGRFAEAIALGTKLADLGTPVANKSAAVWSLNADSEDQHMPRLLEQAATRGEAAVLALPDYANAHYTLALVLGRFGQRISIVRALAEGFAGRVQTHLTRTLELEPQHAEAHVALGLYHAEIVAQLGGFGAHLTYGASAEAAITHFKHALKLTPHSPIALMEYAHGLLRLDARGHAARARQLLRRAASCDAADAMERLDRERAQRELDSGAA